MDNVIHLNRHKEEKRMEARVAERTKIADQAKMERLKEATEIWGVEGFLGQLDEEKKMESPNIPAYSNPENETRGEKYEATAGLRLVDIAKRMRQDIAAAKKGGRLPKALKASVRCSRGSAIDLFLTALPENFRVYTREYVDATKNFTASPGHEFHLRHSTHTDDFTAILEILTEIHDAYNRDNSDSMSDYFDRRYYGSVGVHWEFEKSIQDNKGSA